MLLLLGKPQSVVTPNCEHGDDCHNGHNEMDKTEDHDNDNGIVIEGSQDPFSFNLHYSNIQACYHASTIVSWPWHVQFMSCICMCPPPPPPLCACEA